MNNSIWHSRKRNRNQLMVFLTDPRSEVTCTQRLSKRSFVRVVSVVLKTSIKKIWIARRITSGPNQRAIVFWSWMVLRVTERFPIKKNFCYNSHENFYFPMYDIAHPLFIPYSLFSTWAEASSPAISDREINTQWIKFVFNRDLTSQVVFNSKSFKI